MGCGPSKQRDPETVDEWLRQQGLPQYIPAFKAAGYDDLTTLAHLNRTDLKCVEEVTGEPVLPGHQKRLLLAAPQLRELRAQKRRAAAAAVAVPELVPADSTSNSPLQESVGQLSITTGAASQVDGTSTPSAGPPSPPHVKPPQRPGPPPKAASKAVVRQRAPSIQARARMWSPNLAAGAPAGAAAVPAAGDKAAQGLVPPQKENLNPQASPAHSSIASFPGPTASGTFVVERPPEPETDDDAAQGGMGSFVSGSQRRVRSASNSSHMSAESSGSRMTTPSVSNAPSRRASGSGGAGRGRGRGRGPPPSPPKGPMPRWSSGVRGKAWEHEVPPLSRGSRSSSGDGAVHDPEQVKARLAERAAARKEASEGLRAHLRAMRTVTAELAAEEAARSPSKPIGPEWDTTIAENAAAAAAAVAASSADTAVDTMEAGGGTGAQGTQGAESVSGVSSDAASASDTSGKVPPSSNGHPRVRIAGHSDDSGFVQILVPATTPKYAAPGTPAIGTAGGTIGGAGSFGSPAEVPQFGSTAPYGPQAALASQELTLRLPAGQQLPGTPITQAAAAEMNPDWTPWPVTCNPMRNSPPQTPVMFQGAQQPAPFAGGLPSGYSPVAAANATPPAHFAPSVTVAEATGIAPRRGGGALIGSASLEAMQASPTRHSSATAAPVSSPGVGRSHDAESALQAAGRSVRARLGAHIYSRPSSAPMTAGDVNNGSVGSTGGAHMPPALPGAPMQANLLYDSSPPPHPAGLRQFAPLPPQMASPSMRPPAVSPMVRGAPPPPQPAASTDSPSASGSTGSSVTGPQVVLKGVEERVRRRMQQHGTPG